MNEQGSTVAASTAEDDHTTTGTETAGFSTPLRFAGFWAAIALPFLHTPLLITGLDTNAKLVAYVVLLGLNVAALVVGHSYRPT